MTKRTAMKKMLFAFLLVPFVLSAQNKPDSFYIGESVKESNKTIEDGYTLQSGWTIRNGDTLLLGKGSMEGGKYAFIYESPVALGGSLSMDDKRYLRSAAAQFARVKQLFTYGNKKSGYSVWAKIGVGDAMNYWMEIDNAVDAGEIIPPKEYAAQTKSMQNISVADELKKLKDLLDQGVLTQDEFDLQKKKLLNQ